MRLRKKFIFMLLVMSGLLIFSACANQPQLPAQTPAFPDLRSYFPAEPGATWTYEGSGNEYAGFTRKTTYRRDDKVQMSESNGGTKLGQVYQVSTGAIIQTLSLEEYYDDYSLLSHEPNQYKILLKAPLAVGTVWQNNQEKREIVSCNETVQVPAGSFTQVVKIKITPLNPQRNDLQFEYYAPQTGLIMREFVADGYVVTSKLKLYAF